jgi:tagatose-1,6-bisphosphate aldolase
LGRASTAGGHFTVLALDHQDALRRALNPPAPETVTPEQVIAFKDQVVRALAPETSGVLLDPIYGAPGAIRGSYLVCAGLLVELEKADYQLQPMPLACELLPDWGVAKIKRLGADGVKLFFYYNPDDSALAGQQEALLRRVVAECAAHDIPLYAEPIIYPIGEDERVYAEQLTGRVIDSARRVAALGADILKLEFPVHPAFLDDGERCRAACAHLSAVLDIPWVLLSAGVSFEAFCRQVEIACAAGASGYIVGRAVWGEAAGTADEAERADWLQTVGRERLRRLAALAAGGCSWTDKLLCESVTTGWYRRYGEGGGQ